MNNKLIIRISTSLLLAHRKQTMVAAIGVTFSITMFIALLGFMNGLNDLLDGLILNRTAHVRLFNEIQVNENQPINQAAEFFKSHNFINSIKPSNSRLEIHNNQAILNFLKKDKRVTGIAPKIVAQVFFNAGTVDLTGIINGIDAEAESQLFHFNDYVTSGNSQEISNVSNSIIIGKGLAHKLLANIGDVIQITTPQGERFQLKVVGFFQSGIQEYDKVQSFASIRTVQKKKKFRQREQLHY